MKKRLLMVIVISLIITIVEIDNIEAKTVEENGIDYEHFQRLVDIKLFNSTELLPEYIVQNALVPKGFFDPLEKKLNISNLGPIRRKELSSSNYNKYNFNSNISNNIFNVIKGKYVTFSGNVTKMWNKSLNDYVSPVIVPDIDGDGKGDIITTNYTYDANTGIYYYTFKARKGTNGNILWTKFLGGKIRFAYMIPAGDLNGDGSGDLLLVESEYNPNSDKYDSNLNGINGKDGSILWHLYYSGTWITPYPSRDLNGFGPDILVNTISDNGDHYSSSAIDGRNGYIFWQDSSNLNMWGYPAGDIDNDGEGFADILLNKQYKFCIPYPAICFYAHEVDAVNVKYSKVIWSIAKSDTTDFEYFGTPIYRDLNSDNIEDIYTDYQPRSGDFELEVKSGNTGTTLWNDLRSRFFTYATIYGLNDLDNNGYNDVVIDFYSPGPYYKTAYVSIRDGYNGDEMWQEFAPNAEQDAIVYFYPAGDLDGDRLDDILINIIANKLYDTSVSYRSVTAYKGSNGVRLWTEWYEYDMDEYNDIHGYPAGDLDSDGINDVLIKYEVNIFYNGFNISAKKGINGNLIWKANSCCYIDIGYAKTNDVPIYRPTWIYSNFNGDGYYDTLLAPKNELIALTGDVKPPASISNLRNVTYKPTYIKWVWKDPVDSDFAKVRIYINGFWKKDVLKGVQYYNATGLIPNISYIISTRTIDINGNINKTWVNKTAITARDYMPPASIRDLKNITYKRNYINWTWKDPIDIDFSKVRVYINGVWKKDVLKGVRYYNSTGLKNNTLYRISTHTVDTSDNVNKTWVNKTARTAQ